MLGLVKKEGFYIFQYEDCNYDAVDEKQFDTLEQLQAFVKNNIAHDLTMLPLSLTDRNGNTYDAKEYVNKVFKAGEASRTLPLTEMMFDDKTRSMKDVEQL
jgi:hypothetical protein